MKTKTKRLAMLEIAIVLCSLFLVALPGIAAEQPTQKVSANTITTVSEDDYVLGIYGNANEDDTIDMRDLTYVKLIFFGKKPVTELADAKYDGKINPLDFIQIKLIIVGKEKELTFVDTADRVVTVKKPVERVIPLGHGEYGAEAIRLLGAKDRMVGVSTSVTKRKAYFPEISKLPLVGNDWYPDIEAILSHNPDLVITYKSKAAGLAEKLSGIPVFGIVLYKPEILREELVKLGYIFDKEDEAEHYINDFHGKYVDLIKVRTKELSEEERPKMYVENYNRPYKTYAAKSGFQQMVEMCGGRNIFADLSVNSVQVDAEEVVMRDPDIIIIYLPSGEISGYGVDNPSQAKAARDEIMNRPELAKVSAGKDGKVYMIDVGLQYGLDHPIAMAYWVKWLHSDLFEDLDPPAIHQEYINSFCPGLDYDVKEHGVFVYHPEEHPDGK